MKMSFIYRAILFLLLGCIPVGAQTSLPALHITTSNGVSTVFWPLTASNYILQATTDLPPTATWTNLVAGNQTVALNTFLAMGGAPAYTTNKIGNQFAFSLPAASDRQFFRLSASNRIPACCFAVFYNGLLEFSQSADMVMNGRVHANGPIYVGTSASQTFNFAVTTTSNLTAPFVDGITSGWNPSDPSAWNVTFNGTPGYITNFSSVGITGLSMTNYHFLIDIPPVSEDSMSATGQLRLYNQAQMILIVTNDINKATDPMVTMILQASFNQAIPGSDPAKAVYIFTDQSPSSLATNLPFLNLTNRFYEQREYKTNFVTDIDVGNFSSWVATNLMVQSKLPSAAGIYPTILYVADRRTVNSKQLAVVRLNSGAQLPENNGSGFTIATLNPLYVWGNYNTQTSGSSADASANTNDTTFTVPAALLSDSLTVLSARWTDAASYTAYSTSASAFRATNDTINAAIITGTVPSTGTSGTTFSGGIHNLPRLLENWSSMGLCHLWLNTSVIRLWDSKIATNQFRNPAGFNPAPVKPYYNPPIRHFNFDANFLNPAKIPPGIPIFEVIP